MSNNINTVQTPETQGSDKGDETQHKKPELIKRHTLTVVLSKKSLNIQTKREERKQVAVKTVADSQNPKKSHRNEIWCI